MDGSRRYAGIDWAKDGHAVCVVEEAGGVVARFEVTRTDAGLRELVRRLGGVDGVAIERPDGPVIDALLEAGLRVVVIASRHVKALRTRHGLAGNKDDRSDAYVLADALRTDGHRLRPLLPDTPATVALRAMVRARKDLVHHRVALVQQLEAHLALVLPGAATLFDDLASDIARAFLLRFPSADRAAWLGPRRLAAWLEAHGYSGKRTREELHARLQAAPRGLDGETAEAMAAVTLALLRAVGATPSTRQSGGHRAVAFRWSCDERLREALIDFAADSRPANPWAADVYRRARARGKTHPHAVRILARAWVDVIWRCWQDRLPYDPLRHHGLQRVAPAQAA